MHDNIVQSDFEMAEVNLNRTANASQESPGLSPEVKEFRTYYRDLYDAKQPDFVEFKTLSDLIEFIAKNSTPIRVPEEMLKNGFHPYDAARFIVSHPDHLAMWIKIYNAIRFGDVPISPINFEVYIPDFSDHERRRYDRASETQIINRFHMARDRPVQHDRVK